MTDKAWLKNMLKVNQMRAKGLRNKDGSYKTHHPVSSSPFNFTRKKRPLNTASQKEKDKWLICEGQAKLFKEWTTDLNKYDKQNQRESDACVDGSELRGYLEEETGIISKKDPKVQLKQDQARAI
jgi:hypothetical protein